MIAAAASSHYARRSRGWVEALLAALDAEVAAVSAKMILMKT